MAHLNQNLFFGQLQLMLPKFFRDTKVCEIGSLDINGSIREHFTRCEYIGFDVAKGVGVDQCVQGQLVSYPSGYFTTTVSAECFEHNPFWVETFVNMLRLTKPSGLVAFSCASLGRAEHGTSRTTPSLSPLTVGQGWEYYRNLDDENFKSACYLDGWFSSYQFLYCPHSADLYFYGCIKGSEKIDELLMRSLNEMITRQTGSLLLTGRLSRG